MNEYFYFWGTAAFLTGIILMVNIRKKRKSISAVLYGAYRIFAIIMVCLGIITVLLKEFDYLCSILFGITFVIYEYKEDDKPSPEFTINYIDHLRWYFIGIGSILYGLARYFLD